MESEGIVIESRFIASSDARPNFRGTYPNRITWTPDTFDESAELSVKVKLWAPFRAVERPFHRVAEGFFRFTGSTPFVSPLDRRLQTLSALDDDWDGEGSTAISGRALSSVRDLSHTIRAINSEIADPFVAPLPDGGLQMEWRFPTVDLVLVVPPSGHGIEYLLDFNDGPNGYVESEGTLDVDLPLIQLIDRLG